MHCSLLPHDGADSNRRLQAPRSKLHSLPLEDDMMLLTGVIAQSSLFGMHLGSTELNQISQSILTVYKAIEVSANLHNKVTKGEALRLTTGHSWLSRLIQRMLPRS